MRDDGDGSSNSTTAGMEDNGLVSQPSDVY
jgi:hypothetical protein